MRLIALLALLPTMAIAHGPRPLTGPEIEAVLNDATVVYEGGEVQTFHTSGRTLYDNGRPSWGYWAVRGNQYCSQWPPADGWACYDVAGAHNTILFISETGFVTAGTFRE
ncbi:MAG: hypothetical protein AAF092_08975 [Pseudomonadota bacterium]